MNLASGRILEKITFEKVYYDYALVLVLEVAQGVGGVVIILAVRYLK